MESQNSRIESVVENALKNMQNLVDASTVVGHPVKTDTGDCIIPVSKVSFGVLSGGGEYGKLTLFKHSSDLPFSAGNGTIVSVKPCGFLIKSDGEYKVLSIGTSSMDSMIDKVADFLGNLNKEETND